MSLIVLNFDGFIIPYSMKIIMLRKEGGSKILIFLLSLLVSFFIIGGIVGVVYEVYCMAK